MTLPIQISNDVSLARQHIAAAMEVCIDTEDTGVDYRTDHLVAISLYVPGDTVGFCFVVDNDVDPPSTLTPRQDALDVVRLVFNDPTKTAIFHNAQFDLLMLRKDGLKARCKIFDTLLAARSVDGTRKDRTHSVHGDLNYRLKDLASHWFNANPQTFQQATGGLPAQMVYAAQLAPYAVSDVYWTSRLYEYVLAELNAKPRIKGVLESLDFPLIPIIVEMMIGGIPVDRNVVMTCMAETQQKLKDISDELRTLFGDVPDIKTKDGIRHVLVYRCRITRAGGQRSFSKESLHYLVNIAPNEPSKYSKNGLRLSCRELAREFVAIILKRRSLAHQITGFYIPFLRHTENSSTLHVLSFQPDTDTYRFVSKEPNAQALPKQKKAPVRKAIKAPPGFKIVAMDFANIEPRCLAQALTAFLSNPESDLTHAKEMNRLRAREEFPHLLDEREWLREYQEPIPPEYPTESVLANCFLSATAADPYVFVAERLFPELSDEERQGRRDEVKQLTLAVIYGRGVGSFASQLQITIQRAGDLLDRFEAAFPEVVPFRDMMHMVMRHTGVAVSLFGRERHFAGLFQLRQATAATVRCYLQRELWEFDVAPVQLWNYTLHSYVHEARNYETQQVIATTASDNNHPIFAKSNTCLWPFRNLSYKTIRSCSIGQELMRFTPLEDVQRGGFNAIFQMTSGDVFKAAMLRVQPVCQSCDARMILNVHDELVFLVPDSHLHNFIADARSAMEQSPASWWTIPIRVDVKVGPSYGEMEKYVPPTPSPVPLPWWQRLILFIINLIRRILRI